MWQKLLTGILAAACAALAIVLAHDKPETTRVQVLSREAVIGLPDSSAAQAALSRRIAAVRLDSVSLEQALDTLARLGQTRFDVRWRAIETGGIVRATKVTLRLQDVTLARALTEVLGQTETEKIKLYFTAADGVIVVTTYDDLAHYVVTAVYNVRDLVEMAQGIEGLSREESVDALLRHITETIYPETWRDAGGSAGAIREDSGLLVITQTAEGHEATVRLLEQLRAADRQRLVNPNTRNTPQRTFQNGN